MQHALTQARRYLGDRWVFHPQHRPLPRDEESRLLRPILQAAKKANRI